MLISQTTTEIVWYQKPQRRTIFVNNGRNFLRKYFLSFPHIYFIIHFGKYGGEYYLSRLKINFREELGYTNNSSLYLPIPNLSNDIHGKFKVCLPDHFKIQQFANLNDLIKESIESFWLSRFDITEMFDLQYHCGKKCATLDSWERATKEDLSWIPNSKDANSVINVSQD